MPKKTTKPKVITKKTGSQGIDRLAQISMIVSFILILLGALGLIFFQAPLRESQDIRQQASVEDGQVVVTASPASGSSLHAGQEETIVLNVNTHGVQTDGVQLVFNVVSDEIVDPPTVEVIESSGLEASYQEIEQTTDGYLISLIALPDVIGDSFAADSDTPFVNISFTAQAETTVELNFDVENSISSIYHSEPVEDELKTIPTLTYNVLEQITQASPSPEASASPNTSPSPSPTPTPDASPSPDTSPSPTPSESPDASPSPSPTPSSNTNIGGATFAQCNDSCVYNKECSSGLRCYSGKCRLATNVSSETCYSPPDQGISNECNEYCADNRECEAGLTCYFNRCRNPLNVESTACSAPSSQTVEAIAASCGESCDTHADCAANLLCYSKTGTCRLASNPSSLSCSPTTQKTVSPIYGTGGDKGGDDTTGTGSSTGPLDADTFDNEDAGDAMAKDDEVMDAMGTDKEADEEGIEDEIAQTPLDIIRGYVEGVMSQQGLSLPKILLGSGVGLLILVILALVISRLIKMAGGTSAQTKQEMMTTPPPPRPMPQSGGQPQQPKPQPLTSEKTAGGSATSGAVEQQLQEKINQMKADRQAGRTQPTPTQPQQQSAPRSGSSMADRLKAKGVQTPKQSGQSTSQPSQNQPQKPPQNT